VNTFCALGRFAARLGAFSNDGRAPSCNCSAFPQVNRWTLTEIGVGAGAGHIIEPEYDQSDDRSSASSVEDRRQVGMIVLTDRTVAMFFA